MEDDDFFKYIVVFGLLLACLIIVTLITLAS